MIPWKPLGLLALTTAVLFVVIGFFLSPEWRVERTLAVAAPPEKIAPLVEDLRRWPEWFPWGEKDDPTLRRTFSGEPAGVGARMRYEGEHFGTGEVVVTRADRSGIAYDLRLRDGEMVIDGRFTLAETETGTNVTWSEGGRIDNPLARWFRASFEEANGGDYQRGLLNIQALAEGKPLPFPPNDAPAAPSDKGTSPAAVTGAVEEGAVEGDAVEGDAVEGDAVEGDAVEGDAVEGSATAP